MADPKAPPRFVNLQSSPVGVFDEKGNRINVGCFALRNRQEHGIFIVEGEYYRKFSHPNGPLHPIPKEEDAGPFREDQVAREGDAQDVIHPVRRALMESGGNIPKPSEDSEGDEEPAEEDQEPADEPETDGEDGQDGEEGEGANEGEGGSEGDGTSASAEEDEEEEEVTLAEVRKMKKDDLIALANANEIDSSGNKDELLARIESELFSDDEDE